ncbi:class I SAM-dependent methyltransferase [Micromonospora sp. NPDC007271]|uniref:class I SAM-dependent methyltransferase n=1 Tax=Micromonospora sp. NPDC007271 TaxID=3154587 RepID=UPI00340570D0
MTTTIWEPVPVAAPRSDALLWVNDLRHLAPDYLRRWFHPTAQGLDVRTLARALRGAAPDVAAHVLDSIDPGLAAEVRAYGDEPVSRTEIFQAQLAVTTVYFWEMAYHGHPEVYEQFSALQQPPLDDMFPPEQFRGLDVADVGTGSGRLLVHLAGHAARLIGIDPCRPLLALAGATVPDAELLEGGFDRLPLPDASVDVVVSHGAYQISEERGGERGLAEVRRVLRPGGRGLLAVPNPATSAHLRGLGVREIPVNGGIRWSPAPPDAPALLHHLLRLGQVDYDEALGGTPVCLFEIRP